jgi:hypothetical protein
LLFIASLFLDGNGLTGEVPKDLGDIDRLETIMLSHNSLTGEIPWQVCEIKDLQTMAADCEEVTCDCCTDCTVDVTEATTGAPTPTPEEPTVEATGSPTDTPPTTDGPTSAPTSPRSCSADAIEVESNCYEEGEEITVNFSNCDPQFDDWVGVYPDWVDQDNLGAALLWSWSCGDQFCTGPTEFGSVTFDESFVSGQGSPNWPLDQDSYRVFLIRRTPGGPYSAYAETQRFRIRNNC